MGGLRACGIAVGDLRESTTGVFVGAATSYYGTGTAPAGGDSAGAEGTEGFLLTGTAAAVFPVASPTPSALRVRR